MRFALFALSAASALTASTVPSAPTAPCTTPTTACEQWVTLGGGPGRSMAYASFPLDKPNPAITRALIMVHGAGRNADHYFETAMAAAFLAGALDNTIVLAPRLIASPDKPEPNEIVWPNGRNSWRSGGVSPSNAGVTSFDFLDELLTKLANKKIFTNLTRIVVAGHSAGGQVATRYAMVNKLHDKLGVQISYVVANPSSYAWPAATRPLPEGDANPTDAYKESLGDNGEKVHSQFSYGPL